MAKRFVAWAMPGLIFTVTFAFSACSGTEPSGAGPANCAPTSSGNGGSGGTAVTTTSTGTTGSGGSDGGVGTGGGEVEIPIGGTPGTGNPDNTFDHANDPGESGQKDPLEINKERAEEGPPEIRTRLHGCTKLTYSALGHFLSSHGVDINPAVPPGNQVCGGMGSAPCCLDGLKNGGETGVDCGGGTCIGCGLVTQGCSANFDCQSSNCKGGMCQPASAGVLYKSGGDALGVAKFERREGESYFHTTSGAAKLFDIFMQAAPEIIANVQTAPACVIDGAGKPMFEMDGSCVRDSVSCLMGRPATDDDVLLCTQIAQKAGDKDIKQRLAVATILSAAHTCE
jgi:hypothetical protein